MTAVLQITESALSVIRLAAFRSHPLETGGVLVGVWANDVPWITTAIEISSEDRGPRHFRIPAGTTQDLVARAREDDRRVGYLGDWHSHPLDSPPSKTDLATLGVHSVVHPLRANPSLIVARRRDSDYVFDVRRVVGFRHVVCSVVATGPLLPEAPEPNSTSAGRNPNGQSGE